MKNDIVLKRGRGWYFDGGKEGLCDSKVDRIFNLPSSTRWITIKIRSRPFEGSTPFRFSSYPIPGSGGERAVEWGFCGDPSFSPSMGLIEDAEQWLLSRYKIGKAPRVLYVSITGSKEKPC